MNSDELALIEGMFDRIQRLSSWHCRIEGYYEGSARVCDLGVAIPPELQRVQTVVSVSYTHLTLPTNREV